ncbi:MAG TPA: lytic polysaccharide monooxygenase [Pilimelia sp.]|nr:lytic polysaccharide monooxygenase [Pilimelia sp.]
MRVRRLAAAFAAAALAGALPAAAAGAHGTLQLPASRGYACGPEGGAAAQSAACRAARAAGDIAEWDNLRVADVAGRDREVIPDGRLCSAGIDRYAGLDLPRADWPATRLQAGSPVTVRYRTTIPHRGTFRLHLTTDRYDPGRRLRWSDLEPTPFLSVTDPRLVGGAYTLTGRLPDRAGRHLIYVIWQNSDTPDTYYSCADVVLAAAGPRGGQARRGPAAEPPASRLTAVGLTPYRLGGLALALVAGGGLVASAAALWRRRR